MLTEDVVLTFSFPNLCVFVFFLAAYRLGKDYNMAGRDSVQLHEHMDPASVALPDPTTCVDPRNHIHSPPPLPSILIHSPSPLLPLPLSRRRRWWRRRPDGGGRH
jgi:hypothetical protein